MLKALIRKALREANRQLYGKAVDVIDEIDADDVATFKAELKGRLKSLFGVA